MFVLTRACCEQKAGICLCGQVLRAAGLLLPIHPTEVFILEYVRTVPTICDTSWHLAAGGGQKGMQAQAEETDFQLDTSNKK